MLSVLAQRAASEGPRWTRAIESIPVAPTIQPIQDRHQNTASPAHDLIRGWKS